MISEGRRGIFRRHKLFAKGANDEPMIKSSLINTGMYQRKLSDKDCYELIQNLIKKANNNKEL